MQGHVIAVRPGHALNSELANKILHARSSKQNSRKSSSISSTVLPDEKVLDIRRVLDTLPHRYPFVLVDRVLDIDDEGTHLRAVKNVTINEPYFQGHFPGRPVMPGVLQVEAMAQAAGILMLRRTSSVGKVAFFMSCDKVKFRQAVEPGDQLEIDVELVKMRGNKIAQAKGQCKVAGKVVSSAELMFTLVDSGE